jgi:hypothetical protein
MAEFQLTPSPAPGGRKYPSGAQKRKRRMARRGPEYVAAEKDRSRKRSKRRSRCDLKTSYLNEVKMSRGCADCGFRAHPAALDFDHLPGSVKAHTIANMCVMANIGMEELAAEVAKCEVVCANCHRIRTWNRKFDLLGAAGDETKGAGVL